MLPLGMDGPMAAAYKLPIISNGPILDAFKCYRWARMGPWQLPISYEFQMASLTVGRTCPPSDAIYHPTCDSSISNNKYSLQTLKSVPWICVNLGCLVPSISNIKLYDTCQISAQSQAPHVSNLVLLKQKQHDELFYTCCTDVNPVKDLYLTHWICPITVLLSACDTEVENVCINHVHGGGNH